MFNKAYYPTCVEIKFGDLSKQVATKRLIPTIQNETIHSNTNLDTNQIPTINLHMAFAESHSAKHCTKQNGKLKSKIYVNCRNNKRNHHSLEEYCPKCCCKRHSYNKSLKTQHNQIKHIKIFSRSDRCQGMDHSKHAGAYSKVDSKKLISNDKYNNVSDKRDVYKYEMHGKYLKGHVNINIGGINHLESKIQKQKCVQRNNAVCSRVNSDNASMNVLFYDTDSETSSRCCIINDGNGQSNSDIKQNLDRSNYCQKFYGDPLCDQEKEELQINYKNEVVEFDNISTSCLNNLGIDSKFKENKNYFEPIANNNRKKEKPVENYLHNVVKNKQKISTKIIDKFKKFTSSKRNLTESSESKETHCEDNKGKFPKLNVSRFERDNVDQIGFKGEQINYITEGGKETNILRSNLEVLQEKFGKPSTKVQAQKSSDSNAENFGNDSFFDKTKPCRSNVESLAEKECCKRIEEVKSQETRNTINKPSLINHKNGLSFKDHSTQIYCSIHHPCICKDKDDLKIKRNENFDEGLSNNLQEISRILKVVHQQHKKHRSVRHQIIKKKCNLKFKRKYRAVSSVLTKPKSLSNGKSPALSIVNLEPGKQSKTIICWKIDCNNFNKLEENCIVKNKLSECELSEADSTEISPEPSEIYMMEVNSSGSNSAQEVANPIYFVRQISKSDIIHQNDTSKEIYGNFNHNDHIRSASDIILNDLKGGLKPLKKVMVAEEKKSSYCDCEKDKYYFPNDYSYINAANRTVAAYWTYGDSNNETEPPRQICTCCDTVKETKKEIVKVVKPTRTTCCDECHDTLKNLSYGGDSNTKTIEQETDSQKQICSCCDTVKEIRPKFVVKPTHTKCCDECHDTLNNWSYGGDSNTKTIEQEKDLRKEISAVQECCCYSNFLPGEEKIKDAEHSVQVSKQSFGEVSPDKEIESQQMCCCYGTKALISKYIKQENTQSRHTQEISQLSTISKISEKQDIRTQTCNCCSDRIDVPVQTSTTELRTSQVNKKIQTRQWESKSETKCPSEEKCCCCNLCRRPQANESFHTRRKEWCCVSIASTSTYDSLVKSLGEQCNKSESESTIIVSDDYECDCDCPKSKPPPALSLSSSYDSMILPRRRGKCSCRCKNKKSKTSNVPRKLCTTASNFKPQKETGGSCYCYSSEKATPNDRTKANTQCTIEDGTCSMVRPDQPNSGCCRMDEPVECCCRIMPNQYSVYRVNDVRLRSKRNTSGKSTSSSLDLPIRNFRRTNTPLRQRSSNRKQRQVEVCSHATVHSKDEDISGEKNPSLKNDSVPSHSTKSRESVCNIEIIKDVNPLKKSPKEITVNPKRNSNIAVVNETRYQKSNMRDGEKKIYKEHFVSHASAKSPIIIYQNEAIERELYVQDIAHKKEHRSKMVYVPTTSAVPSYSNNDTQQMIATQVSVERIEHDYTKYVHDHKTNSGFTNKRKMEKEKTEVKKYSPQVDFNLSDSQKPNHSQELEKLIMKNIEIPPEPLIEKKEDNYEEHSNSIASMPFINEVEILPHSSIENKYGSKTGFTPSEDVNLNSSVKIEIMKVEEPMAISDEKEDDAPNKEDFDDDSEIFQTQLMPVLTNSMTKEDCSKKNLISPDPNKQSSFTKKYQVPENGTPKKISRNKDEKKYKVTLKMNHKLIPKVISMSDELIQATTRPIHNGDIRKINQKENTISSTEFLLNVQPKGIEAQSAEWKKVTPKVATLDHSPDFNETVSASDACRDELLISQIGLQACRENLYVPDEEECCYWWDHFLDDVDGNLNISDNTYGENIKCLIPAETKSIHYKDNKDQSCDSFINGSTEVDENNCREASVCSSIPEITCDDSSEYSNSVAIMNKYICKSGNSTRHSYDLVASPGNVSMFNEEIVSQPNEIQNSSKESETKIFKGVNITQTSVTRSHSNIQAVKRKNS